MPVIAGDRSRPAHRTKNPWKWPVINAAMGMGTLLSTVLADSPGQAPHRQPLGRGI